MAGQQILTLAPEEISRFLMRTRRDRDLERFEVRLDEHLREVLARANDFVPSTAGAILLDDPRAKLQGRDNPGRLTVIACFGGGRVALGAGVALGVAMDSVDMGLLVQYHPYVVAASLVVTPAAPSCRTAAARAETA